MYGTHVWVVFDREGWDEVRREVRFPDQPLEAWSKRPGIAATYDGMHKGEQHVILQLDVEPKSKRPGLPGVITHEAFHAALSICAHVGVQVYPHNDEAGAYVAQWVADLVWYHLPAQVEI